MVQKALVGKKQEIYLPKEVRRALAVKPGDRLLVLVKGEGQVLLKRIPSPLDLLAKRAKGSITVEEDLAMRRELSRTLEA